jgi:hypothetical protein
MELIASKPLQNVCDAPCPEDIFTYPPLTNEASSKGFMNQQHRSKVLGLLAGILMVSAVPAQGQVAYKLDEDRSLVWWQIDPHFGHLWATTCPADPSWQPGEGHSAGFYINYATRPKIRTTHESESRVPLFPRKTVRPNCRHAVKGQFNGDPATFSNFKGYVLANADSLENGAESRNAFAKKYVYSTASYPNIRFSVDSLTSVTIKGDTVNAIAVGTFELRGVSKATRVQLNGLRKDNTIRVRGHFAMPASELHERFGVSSTALGAGVGLKLWDTLFMGVDLILIPTTGG